MQSLLEYFSKRSVNSAAKAWTQILCSSTRSKGAIFCWYLMIFVASSLRKSPNLHILFRSLINNLCRGGSGQDLNHVGFTGAEVQDFRQKGLEEQQHPSSSHPGGPIPLRMWCEPKESKESPKRFQRSEILNSGNPSGNLPRRARQSITGLDHPTNSTGSSTSSMSSRNTTHLWGSPDPASLVTATRY